MNGFASCKEKNALIIVLISKYLLSFDLGLFDKIRSHKKTQLQRTNSDSATYG